VRLLRVLESGEFFKVGSSKVIKTDVRVVAATNIDITEAIGQGKFREDLYYRLNTVPIYIPPLKERKEDIHLLFRKFAADFADKYRMPVIQLNEEAIKMLVNYKWQGNIRQLKNITEQISIIEKDRLIKAQKFLKYLPQGNLRDLPVLYNKGIEAKMGVSERDLLYKVLFDMKKDINELKKVVGEILSSEEVVKNISAGNANLLKKLYTDSEHDEVQAEDIKIHTSEDGHIIEPIQESEVIEESLSLQDKEIDLIRKALIRHNGKRKNAARELGISERTLYRKIKEYDIN
ncbi:MAG: sigma 54-interacting transcriptional regulator, partial [Bacteroidales bacterium]|nr:sigma 54-interacting transcriptional regulator [Bacteroidales bacterium]